MASRLCSGGLQEGGSEESGICSVLCFGLEKVLFYLRFMENVVILPAVKNKIYGEKNKGLFFFLEEFRQALLQCGSIWFCIGGFCHYRGMGGLSVGLDKEQWGGG